MLLYLPQFCKPIPPSARWRPRQRTRFAHIPGVPHGVSHVPHRLPPRTALTTANTTQAASLLRVTRQAPAASAPPHRGRTPAHPAPTAEAEPAQAVALVQQFYQRFHGLTGVTPTAKELAQATALLTQHGVAPAFFLLTYAREAATATDYHPQTFLGILHYLPRALAAYAMRTARTTTRQAEAAAHAQHEQYAQWRQQVLAQLRARLPPAELAALEAAQQARLMAEGIARCALPFAVRLAVDEILETQAGLPACAAWLQQHAPARTTAEDSHGAPSA